MVKKPRKIRKAAKRPIRPKAKFWVETADIINRELAVLRVVSLTLDYVAERQICDLTEQSLSDLSVALDTAIEKISLAIDPKGGGK